MLSLLLMLYASTLQAILSSEPASSNLMCVSSCSSAHKSSDFSSLASDALFVAHLLFLQLLRDHFVFLTIGLVLWCGLL